MKGVWRVYEGPLVYKVYEGLIWEWKKHVQRLWRSMDIVILPRVSLWDVQEVSQVYGVYGGFTESMAGVWVHIWRVYGVYEVQNSGMKVIFAELLVREEVQK